jgi:hypothetical protein
MNEACRAAQASEQIAHVYMNAADACQGRRAHMAGSI